MDWKRSFSTIARVSSTNGNAGQVVLSFLSFSPEEVNLEEPVFIIFDGLPVPFFIEKAQPRGLNKLIVELTDVKTLKDAEELLGKEVMIQDEDSDEEDLDLIGWTVINQNGRKAGVITDFLDIPGNPCLEIDSQTVIPAADELIIEIDEDANTLYINIADGLL